MVSEGSDHAGCREKTNILRGIFSEGLIPKTAVSRGIDLQGIIIQLTTYVPTGYSFIRGARVTKLNQVSATSLLQSTS
jgi:hypothetical protein